MNVFLKGGRGLKHADKLSLCLVEITETLDQVERVLQTSGRFGSVRTELPKCLVNEKQYEKLDVASRCSAAIGFFVIGPSGYIRVCNHSQINLCYYRAAELKYGWHPWRFLVRRIRKDTTFIFVSPHYSAS